jgi:Zinc finger, C3HC4 type (RING finger)
VTLGMSVAAANGPPAFAWEQPAPVADGAEAIPGHKRCTICYTDPSIDMFVMFNPCRHEACATCMADLRKEAIRKVRSVRMLRDLLAVPGQARARPVLSWT